MPCKLKCPFGLCDAKKNYFIISYLEKLLLPPPKYRKLYFCG